MEVEGGGVLVPDPLSITYELPYVINLTNISIKQTKQNKKTAEVTSAKYEHVIITNMQHACVHKIQMVNWVTSYIAYHQRMDLGSRGGPLCLSRRVDPSASPGTKKVTSHVKTAMLICSSRLLLGSSECHQKYKKLRIRDTPNPVFQFQTRSAINLLQIKTQSQLREWLFMIGILRTPLYYIIT